MQPGRELKGGEGEGKVARSGGDEGNEGNATRQRREAGTEYAGQGVVPTK